MAKNTFVCGSAEQAALELLGHVARAEGVDLSAQHSTDRAWILDTYAECLKGKRCAVALSPSGVWLWLAAPGHEFVDPILRPAVDEAR